MSERTINIESVIGMEHPNNGLLAVYANKDVVKNVRKEGKDLVIETTLKDEDNLVLWFKGDWLYQSHPKKPSNGGQAYQWQLMPLESVSHSLLAPGSARSWCV